MPYKHDMRSQRNNLLTSLDPSNSMGFFEIAILAIIAFITGIICTLIVQFILFKKYLESGLKATPLKLSTLPGRAKLPEELITLLNEDRTNFAGTNSPRKNLSQGNENLAINLTLQFLFNELRNADRVRLWFAKKLNNEFKEFTQTTTTGTFFKSVQLSDLSLGDHFPTIKRLDVSEAKLCQDTGLLETLDLCLDLNYTGNFQMTIVVKTLLNKDASLSLQVKQVTGKARLQFTRVPYTHWSLSFYTDPVLELEVQSQFQGHRLQSQIISLITAQIRRAIRRKHTLPWYKMRFKPFFHRLNEEIDLSRFAEVQSVPGVLDVTLVEVSRLKVDSNWISADNLSQIEIFCTLSVDITPWICLTQYSGVVYMVLDFIISKFNAQQLGVVFKQEFIPEIGKNCVIVESIVDGSPASLTVMKKGDVLIAVNGKKVVSINQINKLINQVNKNSAHSKLQIRVERQYSCTEWEKSCLYKIEKRSTKNETINLDESFKSIKFSDLKDCDADQADKGECLLRNRKRSVPGSNEEGIEESESPIRQISSSSLSLSGTKSQNSETPMPDISDIYYSTAEKNYANLIPFEEKKCFAIDSEQLYLNIGVWAKTKCDNNQQRLVGYVNVPIKSILKQCSTSFTSHYLKLLPLLPPDSASLPPSRFPLNGYSGFDSSLCFGDILLSYVWRSSDLGPSAERCPEDFNKSQPIILNDIVGKKPHDLIKTHFQGNKPCDCCFKKIWLKGALQCRDCAKVCHKKCEAEFQATVACLAECLTFEADECTETMSLTGSESGPEISFTGCEEQVQLANTSGMRASITSTLLGLKKVGSASSLTPPNVGSGSGATRSLPPSPSASRKSSLAVGDLGINPELLEGADPGVASQLANGNLDDSIMTKAKDSGKFLYITFEPQERVDKINEMISKLKTSLDLDATYRQENLDSSDVETIKLVSQVDLRIQALSVLLLHYCSGLQHAQEQLDRPNYSSN